MKKLLFIFSLFLALGTSAQVSTIPSEITSPDDSLTIIVDVSITDCQSLNGDAGPLYIWSWEPSEPAQGNGNWDASNPANEMTNIGPNLWMFKMVPSQFYADVSTFYDTGISFLVKKADGGSGGDCNVGEFKTEDFNLPTELPEVNITKVSNFPTYIDNDPLLRMDELDIFTLIYDNKQEEKASLQDADDFYVYARAFIDDGLGNLSTSEPIAFLQTGYHPHLAMQNDGNGVFSYSLWPNRFFGAPDGSHVYKMEFRIVRQSIETNDDIVDGTFTYLIGCD